MLCVSLIAWMPERRNAKDRARTVPALGVTNYDYCRNVYWVMGEIDRKDVDVMRYRDIASIIVETAKGYHIYTKLSYPSPFRAIREALRLGLDRGQIRMAIKRYRKYNDKDSAYLVLRVRGKYTYKDIKVIYVDWSFIKESEWHQQVLELLTR